MKQLDKVLTNTTWAKASNAINLNNDALYVAVTALEHAAFKHKGYFKTVALLQEAYPTAEEGSQAFVYNSANPTTAPYDIYTWTNTGWQDSDVNGGNVDVNLDDKQDTLVGYSETVSNGKATQIAIEGDTIALGGKVSIGQINNLETAILMSSAQASNAETIANTIKSEVSLLKQPVKPLLLNANGKLELSIGQGLYVSDGKLCADRIAGGSGSGGGTIYSEGAGISILDNKISVAYNMETLGIDSCGGLTVNYGEGLTVKNGKLSATNTVTAGAGVSVQNGEVSLNVGTGLNLEQSTDSGERKVYVAVGRGLEVDNENKINAKVDSATILANSNGALYVNKGVFAGYGLHVLRDKLAVNYGTGLAYDITTGKIHVNYGDGLQSCDGQIVLATGNGLVIDNGKVRVNTDDNTIKVNGNGQLYSTVTSKTYTAGNGIDINGSYINVETPILNLSTRVYEMGNYSASSGAESAAAGASIAGNNGIIIMRYTVDDTKQEGVIVQQVGGNSTVQYLLWGGAIYIRTITFSDTNKTTVTQVREWWKLGAARTKYDSSTRKIHLADAWGNNINGSSNAVLPIASTSVSGLMSTSQVETLNSLGTSKQDKLTMGNGVSMSGSTLSLKLGSGLVIDTQSGDAVVNIGTGLQIGDDKKLFCNVTSKTYTAGNGVAISGDAISVNYGTGLAVSGGKLYSTVTSGKNYTDGNGISISGENKISVKHGDGLKIQDTFLTIATGDGLHLAAGGVLAINPSDGLGFTSDGMLKLKLHEKSGLKVDSEGLGVNVGVALGTVDGKLNVQYGTGLSVTTNKIYVDTSKIAGTGIDLNADNKKLEIGTQAAETLAGSGLVADGSKIKVDAANLTVAAREFYTPFSGTNVRDANVDIVGLIRNYHSPTYWKNMPDGMGYGQMLNLRGDSPTLIGQLAWDVNHGSTTDVTKGLWWRANDEMTYFANSKWHQIAFTDSTVANASALQGYAATNIDSAIAMDRSKVIDLTALQDDKWYPCTLQLEAQQLTEIRIWNCLTSESIPSWSTHRYGFSLQVVWEVTAAGWGAQEAARKIHMSQYKFANAHPCGGITQNTMQSVEIVWLRGGAKYLYHTNNGKNFAVHADGYSWSGSGSSFTAAVRTASQITSPISGYSGTGSISAAAIMYADAFRGLADKATADADGNNIASTYQEKLTMGSGLTNTNNKLSISIGTGLSYDTTSGVPCVALAPQSYLKFYDEGNGMASLSVDLEAIRAALNNSGGASPIDEN